MKNLLKKVALLLSFAMIFSAMPMGVFAEGTAVEVDTYDKLLAALAVDNANIIMTADITADATQSSGYGKAGIVLDDGDVLDGNGNTLTINNANTTWDCVIAMRGGEVKNLTIAGAMRGVFMPGANGDVVIDNCVFEDVIYTFNSDAGSKDYSVTIKNSALNGWTSYSNVHKSVTFEKCTFGEGNGYAYIRPYQETTFTGCEFDKDFEFDTSKPAKNSLKFNECKYDGEPLSSENNDMFYNGGQVVIDDKETDVNHYAAKIGDEKYATLEEAIDDIGDGDVVIELLEDASMDYGAREAFGTDGTTSLTINGNGNTLTLNQTNSDWSSFGLKNPDAKVVFNNMTIEKTGYGDTSGAWNTHTINITSEVEMNKVTVNNAVSVQDGAKLDEVTINEANGYYCLWIKANGQSVTVTNSEMNATNGGRGIKIGDQYVNEDTATVTLTVEDTKFNTAKKAAVLVSSVEGANITATNVDITNVAEDTVNFVWIDEDYADTKDKTTVNGGTVYQEGTVAMIGNAQFLSVKDAIAAAVNGDTIVLVDNVDEDGVTLDENVTLDLNGKTLNGSILAKSGTTLDIKNGNIVNEDKNVSAVETAGKLILTDVNITSARHAVRVDGDAADVLINNGTYKLIGSGQTQHAVNISGNGAKVTIKDGTFVGAGAPVSGNTDSGSAVNVKAGSTVTIEGGDFSGGKLNTLAIAGALTISGGTFDQDPSAYLAPGFTVENNANGYTVVPCTHENATGWTPTKYPTCTTEGEETTTCTTCGTIVTKAIPAYGHADANEDEICDVCRANLDPHNWSDDFKNNDEYHWRYCQNCGKKKTRHPHVDANKDGHCDACDFIITATGRENPVTGVTADMLK